MQTLTFEQFIEHYKPIKNHLDPHAGYGGYLFETYGKELDEVRNHPPHCVWTLIDGENENQWLVSGACLVDRMGYIFTEVPWVAWNEAEVDMNDYVSAEVAKAACLKFWSDHGYNFEVQDVETFFDEERYSYGEAKYKAIEFFEYVTTEEVPDEILDDIHDTFFDYI